MAVVTSPAAPAAIPPAAAHIQADHRAGRVGGHSCGHGCQGRSGGCGDGSGRFEWGKVDIMLEEQITALLTNLMGAIDS